MEDNRNDPSPTSVDADLSGYNNDISPHSNNDSHDEDECYETLSPKKGKGLLCIAFMFCYHMSSHTYPSILSSVNAKEYVDNNNTPTTAMSTQTIQVSPS